MSAKMWKLKLALALAVLGAMTAALLGIKKTQKDLSHYTYEQVLAALAKDPDKFRLLHVAASGNRALGYVVARPGDPRTREEFLEDMITQRRHYVVLKKTRSTSFDDAAIQFHFADGEVTGDPELIQLILDELRKI